MRTQDIFIIHPESEEQTRALTAFVKALKIKFEISTKEEPYNPDFVAKIEKSRKQAKEGQVTRMSKEELQNFLGL